MKISSRQRCRRINPDTLLAETLHALRKACWCEEPWPAPQNGATGPPAVPRADEGVLYTLAVLRRLVWIICADTVIYGGRRPPSCRSGVSEAAASHQAVRPEPGWPGSPGVSDPRAQASVLRQAAWHSCRGHWLPKERHVPHKSVRGGLRGRSSRLVSPHLAPCALAHRGPPSPSFTLTQPSQEE